MIKKILLTVILVSVPFLVFAKQLISTEQALKKIFQEATSFKEIHITLNEEQMRQIEQDAEIIFSGNHSNQVAMYRAYDNNLLVGFAFKDTVVGKWGPIHYLVGLNPQGKVLQSIILGHEEDRGKPIAKRRFLKQYNGKDINDPIKLRKDIDGITGATISSRAVTDGIRKLVHIFEIIKKDQSIEK